MIKIANGNEKIKKKIRRALKGRELYLSELARKAKISVPLCYLYMTKYMANEVLCSKKLGTSKGSFITYYKLKRTEGT